MYIKRKGKNTVYIHLKSCIEYRHLLEKKGRKKQKQKHAKWAGRVEGRDTCKPVSTHARDTRDAISDDSPQRRARARHHTTAHGVATYSWCLAVPRQDHDRLRNDQDQRHHVNQVVTLLDLCVIPSVTPSQRLGSRLAVDTTRRLTAGGRGPGSAQLATCRLHRCMLRATMHTRDLGPQKAQRNAFNWTPPHNDWPVCHKQADAPCIWLRTGAPEIFKANTQPRQGSQAGQAKCH